jgi:tetratricopeptide (TPR) repeat protein
MYAVFCSGDYREGVAACDRAIALADGDATMGGGINYTCPYAWCHGFKGLLLIGLGELDEARGLIEQSRRIAREQGDAEIVAYSHLYATYLAYLTGDEDAALADARAALEIAERVGNSFIRAYAWFTLGLAHRMCEQWQTAIDAFERSAAIARDGGTAIEIDSGHPLLAECYAGLGDVERARALVTQGLATSSGRGHVLNETFGALALVRVLLASDDASDAEVEAALLRALELVRKTGAKGFEPHVHVEAAELAARRGDSQQRERALREAQRLFREIGAPEQANRLDREFESVPR